MSEQNYSNHRKFYPAHHFIFLPMAAIATVVGVYKYCTVDTDNISWLLFGIGSFFTLYLAIMLRQHYALGNQNRIIRLEFRLRYYELFGKPAAETEQQLNFGQMAALRFAGDEEFKMLLQRALAEKLSGNEIKKAIKNWQADHMRV